MPRTNFEKLRVYQLSEELADEIWDIVVNWDHFAKDTIGKQVVRAADSLVRTLQKARDAEATKTIGASLKLRVVRCKKHSIGFGVRLSEICLSLIRLPN